MDAHLFRRLTHELPRALIGLRIEKIYCPHPDCRILTLYGNGRTLCLTLMNARQRPFLHLGRRRLMAPAGPAEPDSRTMLLRKHLKARRILDVLADWPRRRLALELAGEGVPFALLDLKDGLTLSRELPSDFGLAPEWPGASREPDSALAAWPNPIELAELLAGVMPRQRRLEQVITPLLWRTCSAMLRSAGDAAEALPDVRALLADLEDGRGDVFLYSTPDSGSQPVALSAWPLPEELLPRNELKEEARGDCLAAVEQFGEAHAAALIGADYRRAEAAPRRAEEKRLQRLLKKLEAEEGRLSGLAQGLERARLIQMRLFSLDRDVRLPELRLPDPAIPGGEIVVPLDARFTIRENMERLFHQADRGRRGLARLAERRAQTQAALTEAKTSAIPANFPKGKSRGRPDLQKADRQFGPRAGQRGKKNSAKHISAFVSSDGLTILRGRNAAGNVALVRLAAGHDYWLHVQDSPSAHVLIRRDHARFPVPERTLLEAAQLSALKSGRRADTHVEVMVALAKDVRSIKGAPEGTVSVRETLRSLAVEPDDTLEDRLLNPQEGTP